MSTSEDECKKNIMTFFKKFSKTETNMYDYCAKDNFVLERQNKNVFEYNGISGSRHRLSFKKKNVYHRGYGCTCSYFVKNALCSH